MQIINLVNQLLAHKVVVVPLAMVCMFEVELMREGIQAVGGKMFYVNREPKSMEYLLS